MINSIAPNIYSQPTLVQTDITTTRQKQLDASVTPNPMPKDNITAEIDNLRGDMHTVVFIGFSGLGYENLQDVKNQASQILDQAISNYQHKGGVALVIGGTTDGIGAIYSLVNDKAEYKNIKCIGIVSEVVQDECPDSISSYCKGNMVYVPDPNQTWEVLNADATHSYTAYAAENNGELHALGAGAVGVKEIKMAINQGVSPYIFDYKADQKKIDAKIEQGKLVGDLMPISKFF